MISKIFTSIDELYDEYVGIWEDICNIESPTDHKEGIDKVGAYIADKAEALGFEVEVFPQPVAGDAICITMNPEAKGAPVCLSAHMDTVFPVGFFGTPAVHKDSEYIYGPGVVDCKGGIAVALLAMNALANAGFDKRPVKLILQSDEEGGSARSGKATIGYMLEKARGAVAFLNLEGHSFHSDELCLKRKGILTFEFKIKGKAAHSSQCATVGANAILEAAYKITELEKQKDEGGITCCCSIIEGGTTPNTVPENCSFKVNVRFATAEQEAWMKNYAKELAKKTFVEGCTTTVEIVSDRVAMELVDRNIELLEKMNAIFVKNGFAPYKCGSRSGGSDAAYVTVAGIPCVDNVGAEGGKIHSQDEFGVLESLREMAKRVASVCAEI